MPSLDGLRGVAALVVCIHHALLCLPALAVPYMGGEPLERFGVAWWWSYTPLHVVWAGGEAVIVFFVLSGFVLSRPFVGQSTPSRKPDWPSYYPKRIVRLYAPVWVATAFAVANIVLIERRSPESISAWLAFHGDGIGKRAVLEDLALLNHPGASSSVLWSLKYEVIFSLTLPLWIWLARRMPARWGTVALPIAIAAASATWGAGMQPYAYYMAVFFVGVALARVMPAVVPLVSRPGVAAAVLLLMIVLTTWSWTRRGMDVAPAGFAGRVLTSLDRTAVIAAAVIAVWACLRLASWQRVLDGSWLQWLGTRSFSLYLIHEPIVVAYSYLVGGLPSVWGLLLVAVPMALLLTELFYRWVERPSIVWAGRAGRAMRNRTSRLSVTQPV